MDTRRILLVSGLRLRKLFDLLLRRAQPKEHHEMADLTDDFGIPTKPTPQPSQPPTLPPTLPSILPPILPKAFDNAAPSDGSPSGSVAPPTQTGAPNGSQGDRIERKTLIVGHEILLSGHVASCDRFVVEGNVEVTLDHCQHLEITATGLFKGNASAEHVEVSGRFDGDLTVRKRLLIRATGSVSGAITYQEIEIERGGKIFGSIAVQEPKSTLAFLSEPAFARSR